MRHFRIAIFALGALGFSSLTGRSEVIIQYFETRWDEIYQRLPEIAEIGYESIWTPPPGKSPIGGPYPHAYGGNVGYNSYDRFDLGDHPQRGHWETRYGSRTSMRNMVDNAHQMDLKIYPDIVFNHTGNGPDYRTYPGMVPQDFHVWVDASQPGGFRRAPRMFQWTPDNGFGGTLHQELVSLMDIVLEFDGRFQGNNGPRYAADPTPFLRHPGDPEKYPYFSQTGFVNENSRQFVTRWINWLGYAMDYDGVRLDAPKHVAKEYFGLPNQDQATKDQTLVYNIQRNFNERRGLTDADPFDEMYQNYIRRDDALVYSEFFIGSIGETDYWRDPVTVNGQQVPGPWGIRTRYLDFPRKSQMIMAAFNGGNLAALDSFAGFSPEEGVIFAHSHDEDPPGKLELAYAYILTRVGTPVVYFTGNNLADNEDKEENGMTWMRKGYDGALGDFNLGAIPNLIYIHNQFARGKEWNRWRNDNDFFAYERYEDSNNNNSPDPGEGLLLVALNDSGTSQTRNNVTVSFPVGTRLKDYTGRGPDITVYNNNGVPQVNVTVPPGNGQGFVCYAPYNAEGPVSGSPITFTGEGVSTMPWVIPGGRDGADKPRTVTRLRGDSATINVFYREPAQGGEQVDNVVLKWGQGRNLNAAAQDYDSKNVVIGGYEQMTREAAGHYKLDVDLRGVPEGLHTIKARAFNGRADGLPAVYQTFTTTVYVDRRGPDLAFTNLNEGETIEGARVVTVENADRTLHNLTYSVNGGPAQQADQVIKGRWRIALDGLSNGANSITLNATEADRGAPRAVINTSTLTRNFTVDTAGQSIAINHASGATIAEPFFKTVVTVPTGQGITANDIKLFWNGYEQLPLVENPVGSGKFESIFNGRYRQGGVDKIFYGAFVNGPNFFEAVVTKNGQENRVARRVVFNLYGQNLHDSDGDGLPDNIEIENFLSGRNPGPNRALPGDGPGLDNIPNFGENWTRLNPMNAETFYNGQWDGDGDFDRDGVSNLQEVITGFRLSGNPTQFSIYNSASVPPSRIDSFASSVLSMSGDNKILTITYRPNQGPLQGASQIYVRIVPTGGGTAQSYLMTESSLGVYTYAYTVPAGATSLSYTFADAANSPSLTDATGSSAWTSSTSIGFVMNGQLDSANYEVASYDWMRLWAAVRGDKLYVATWGTGNNSLDHFVFLGNNLGNATNAASAWNKNGLVFLNNHVYLAGEGETSYSAWSTSTGSPSSANAKGDNTPNNYLEGVIDLKALNGGTMPEAIYIAAGAFATTDNGTLQMQAPAPWDTNEHFEVTEFQRIPIESIRDENIDGHFDVGSPLMWTLVGDNRQDANYGLRRFFLDETKGDQEWLTVELEPRTGRDNQIAEIEVFTNLNRREFAKLPGEEDPDTVTATSLDTYYLGHPMSSVGNGRYSVTLPVRKCGAYRINARWRFQGSNEWHYYTDNGLRRDTAVVVSPQKSLDTSIYVVNPLTAEATSTDFNGRSTFRNMYETQAGRPGAITPNNLQNLGVNMIWLQPIHPIGTIGRQIDPLTWAQYDPGSPYAVRNYWQVNPVLGSANNSTNAMQEFQQFVQAYEQKGIGIMLDGTFNHSAWDAEIGEMATRLGLRDNQSNLINPTSRISSVRPAWYSRKGNYGLPATFFNSITDNDMAEAPDRVDFGKWSDAADFFFGRYDSLVQGPIPPNLDTSANRWFSGWNQRYLREDDRLEPLEPQTKELWRYFANYSLFWLEKTGLTAGQPVDQQDTGIAGLRCDFAQGLPNEFWEYKVNKTRAVKWDFLFMAESLDGNRVIDGNPRHGVGYRSARHFDILNENMVFVWRNQFFNYRTFVEQTTVTPNRSTGLLWQEFDKRKNAFELSPILLNLTSHDEIFPTDDQWSLAYAHAITTAMDGVPMIFYGQEMGAQNDILTYGARTDFSQGISASNNFAIYESNFGKSIPNFKRYNNMTNVWSPAPWKDSLRGTYARLNQARLNSPALRSQQNYFLADRNLGGWNNDIFAVAKLQQPGVSAHQQDVVFAFVNNNFRSNAARAATFNLAATNSSGANWFGIQADRTYNVVDLASTNPTAMLWGTNGITGSALIANGIYVGFQTNTSFSGGQAQYLRLIDMTAGMTATNVNDYFANLPRLPAPQINAIGNRTVRVGQTLNFNVVLNVAQGDTATISAASSLAPANWTFGGDLAQFSFTPVASEIGTHTFRFTASGSDGTDEETISIVVTSAQTPYQSWADVVFGQGNTNGQASADPDGDGVANLAEFHLGTDPTNANSRLRLAVNGWTNGTASLQIQPVASNGVYHIAQTTSLASGWTNPPQELNRSQHLSNPQGHFTLPANELRTFFRVIYQPPAE